MISFLTSARGATFYGKGEELLILSILAPQ